MNRLMTGLYRSAGRVRWRTAISPPRRGSRALGVERLEPRQLLAADPIINEFMARNDAGLRDGDGRSSDWIEIFNRGDLPVDLAGYRLTDRADNLSKWTFPSTVVQPGGYLVVFASGASRNDYVDAAGSLHTNFTLARGGEYLALVSPAGTVVSEFGEGGTDFPEQLADVSYGAAQQRTLIDSGSPAAFLEPLDDSVDATWIAPDFDAAAHSFLAGTASMGFETKPNDRTNFVGQFQTELPDVTHAVYARMEFDLRDASAVSDLSLTVRYDDGFVAYLNGVKVAAVNAPERAAWYSSATDKRGSDSDALEPVTWSLREYVDALIDGRNVLAIHGLNSLTDNSDMLIVPELTAIVSDMSAAIGEEAKVGFMPSPTPGAPNGSNEGVFANWVRDTTIVGPGGFHDAPVQVEIMTESEGAEIRYTTDGRPPTAATGTVYAGPITVRTTTTLRAAAFQPGSIASRIDTQSYIFLDDVVHQPADPPGFPATWGSGLPADYEMDPSYPATDAELRSALEALPSISIVMDPDALFGAEGIYDQGGKQSNTGLERPASVEWFLNDHRQSFQIDAGIQPRSHAASTAMKRGFQLEFKAVYGASKLEQPVFEDALESNERLPTTFDKLILRSGFVENYTGKYYDHEGQIYIRDPLVRDSQIAMSGYGTRSEWLHVYVNGLYWGMYNLAERINEEWARDVFGGEEKNWLVVKSMADSTSAGEIETGDRARYDEMLRFFRTVDLSIPENYAIATSYLDPVAFADYIILQNYFGVGDWPTNNWTFLMHNGDDPQPGFFVAWDAEKALYPGSDREAINVSGFASKDFESNVQAWMSPHLATTAAVPSQLWRGMVQSESFRILFADRVWKHMFHDGPLTDENLLARFDAHAARVEPALIADQARWSDDTRRDRDKGRTFTKSDWDRHIQLIRGFIDGDGVTNVQAFIQAFRDGGLLPSIDAPVLSQPGGRVAPGFSLTMSTAEGATTWVTSDGSDPRRPDGTVSPSATMYVQPVALGTDTTVKARSFKEGEWSALSEAVFAVAEIRRPGDANDDGRFDQRDIVKVLQAAKYMTDDPADWTEGDWNDDGRFNQGDIVLALQEGNYDPSPAAAHTQALEDTLAEILFFGG